MAQETDLRELVAEVAAAYFSNSHVNTSDIPTVIAQIAASLKAVADDGHVNSVAPEPEPEPEAPKRATPAQIRKSITDDGLVSFEDGKSYKTLKRHLATRDITPALYRTKWGLPADYPMTAPSYSARRSALAKSLGLGQKVNRAQGGRKPKAV